MRTLTMVGLVGLMVTAVEAQQRPLFQAANTINLPGAKGDYVAAMAVGDVGGAPDGTPDGIPDVIALNRNQAAPTLFGRGDGTLRTGPSTILNVIPTSLAVADFDGDGNPDLLVTDTSDRVLFFRGRTAGPPFTRPAVASAAGDQPVAVVAADVNRDGNMDAVVVNAPDFRANGVTVLLGKGDGTFDAQTLAQAGNNSTAVVVADFGSDGSLDAAVTNAGSNTVSVFRGNGTGFLTLVQEVPVGQEPVGIASGDLNTDGRVDLVVANRSGDSVSVLIGRSNGTFDAARSFSSGSAGSAPSSVALADIDLDGVLDVLVASKFSSDVSVLRGQGDGTLAAPRAFVAEEEPEVVASGDFNDDGVPDVVTINQGSDFPAAVVQLSLVNGSLAAVEDVIALPNPAAITAGDVNNDGLSDLVVAHSASAPGNILVYPATLAGGFGSPTALTAGGQVVAVNRGDFNRDGILDLVTLDRSAAGLSVFLGQANGSFAAPRSYSIGTGGAGLVVGDWNRDGYADLAVVRQGSAGGSVEVLRANADGSFGAPVSLTAGDVPVGIDAGDFNNDGRLDLAVANSISNNVSIFIGNVNGTFQAPSSVPTTGGPRAIVVSDFDRDGFDDFAVTRQVQSAVTVFYGDGQGRFASSEAVAVRGSAAGMAARDVSGDDIPDLLVADQVANAVVVLVGTGFRVGSFERETYTVSRGPVSAVAADFSGDGRYDGASANGFVAGSASVLTNIGALAVLRGDGNLDSRVSAADLVALARELPDNATARADRALRGSFPAGPGIDANGDGLVTAQDAAAVIHRVFAGS